MLTHSQFLMSVGIIFAFLVLIFLAGRNGGVAGRDESVRRKLFHLGPILVVPVLYSMDLLVLVAILTAAAFVFLALEVIRYSLFEMRTLLGGSR